MATPERIAWAIGHLAIKPGDRLLEIGCGRGIAIAEIMPLLIEGRMTGLDRSDSAVSSAEERNRDAIASGRATIQRSALADRHGPENSFDKVFAINVNLFWLEAARELAAIRTLLVPEGRLFLFFEPPSTGQIPTIERAVAVRLKAAGYALEKTVYGPSPKPPLLGMSARPAT